jgi:bifunctional enzyme CysN/CysC
VLHLNQIGSVTVTSSAPLVFDGYRDNRTTGSFILIDPATNFTAGAGMIGEPVREHAHVVRHDMASRRIARAARAASTDAEAAEAVRVVLEEILK